VPVTERTPIFAIVVIVPTVEREIPGPAARLAPTPDALRTPVTLFRERPDPIINGLYSPWI
jgi:hypothetical protein